MFLRFTVTIIIFTGICPLLVFGDCNLIEIPNGRSSLRMKGRAISFTCNEGFVLYGESYDQCKSGFWSRPPPRCVAPGCPLVQNITNGDVRSSHTGSVIEVTCNNGMTIQGESLLTCDGQNWSSSIPQCLEPSDVDSCDFESSTGKFCGWSQDQTDDFDWTYHSGQTATGRTGPNTDHTLGPHYTTGHYIYMEASTPRQPGDIARLLSPWYPSDRSNRCFRFWYHMNGPNQMNAVGTLKVLLRTGNRKSFKSKILFTMSGNQGENWKCGHFKIPTCTDRFQIVLETIRQNSYTSDIAVDDWLMFPCKPPDLSIGDPAAQSARLTTVSDGIPLASSVVTTEGLETSTRISTTPPVVRNVTELLTRDDKSTMTTAGDYVAITSTYVSDSLTTSKQSYHTGLKLFKTSEGNYASSTILSTLSSNSSAESFSRNSSAISSIVTASPEVPLSSSRNKLTKTTEISQTDKYLNVTRTEPNFSTLSEIPASTTWKSLSFNSSHKKHLMVFTAEAIVNMCIGLIVLCLFIIILVIMGCICRRQQKIYNDKYQELKLFVETHYRTKYVTV